MHEFLLCFQCKSKSSIEMFFNSVDYNECTSNRSFCPSNTDCKNYQGSYRCVCKTGFSLISVSGVAPQIEMCSEENYGVFFVLIFGLFGIPFFGILVYLLWRLKKKAKLVKQRKGKKKLMNSA